MNSGTYSLSTKNISYKNQINCLFWEKVLVSTGEAFTIFCTRDPERVLKEEGEVAGSIFAKYPPEKQSMRLCK